MREVLFLASEDIKGWERRFLGNIKVSSIECLTISLLYPGITGSLSTRAAPSQPPLQEDLGVFLGIQHLCQYGLNILLYLAA